MTHVICFQENEVVGVSKFATDLGAILEGDVYLVTKVGKDEHGIPHYEITTHIDSIAICSSYLYTTEIIKIREPGDMTFEELMWNSGGEVYE